MRVVPCTICREAIRTPLALGTLRHRDLSGLTKKQRPQSGTQLK
jgi:hypothetical protein